MNNLNLSRTITARLFVAALLLAIAGSALAKVRYVDVNSTNAVPPYTNWTTAATNIQDAVDAAVAGDEIAVSNGTYATGRRAAVGDSVPNRVVVDKALSVQSVNGQQFTIIDGLHLVRCAYLTNGASLSGFTLMNGIAFADGGGAYGGTLNNCTLTGNSVGGVPGPYGGGAAFCTLNNCTLKGNSSNPITFRGLGFGGGAAFSTLNNCTLADNSAGGLTSNASYDGGAIYCLLNNCIVYFNNAMQGCRVVFKAGLFCS